MENLHKEIMLIIAVILIAFIIALFTWESIAWDRSINHNFADILAEILGIIFVLPQVIIQLTLKAQKKDIKSIFSNTLPWYFFYYIIAIVFLSFDFLYKLFVEKWADVIVLTLFMSSLFQIFPYIIFFIKEYSSTENLSRILKKILKKVEKLSNLAKNMNDSDYVPVIEYGSDSAEKKVLNLRLGLVDDINELKEYILIYGNENNHIFYHGIDTLVELIKKLYLYNNKDLDDLLIQIIETISEIGEKIENDASIGMINYRLFQAMQYILNCNSMDFRVNLFILRIILTMEKVSTQSAVKRSRETIRKTIDFINQISLRSLRNKPPINLEYHLLAENFKSISFFALDQKYENCVMDVIEHLSYLSKLSIRSLPVDSLPVYKICDVLSEIGTEASDKKYEVFCLESVNVICTIIEDLKKQNIDIDIRFCLASLLELVANIWKNFVELEEWLCSRLKNLQAVSKVEIQEFINPTIDILSSKSIKSKAIFSDFLDVLESYGLIQLEQGE